MSRTGGRRTSSLTFAEEVRSGWVATAAVQQLRCGRGFLTLTGNPRGTTCMRLQHRAHMTCWSIKLNFFFFFIVWVACHVRRCLVGHTSAHCDVTKGTNTVSGLVTSENCLTGCLFHPLKPNLVWLPSEKCGSTVLTGS